MSTDPRPVTEMSPWADTLGTRPFLHGLWLSDRNEPPQTVDAEIALTKQNGAHAVYLHCDDGSAIQHLNVLDAADRVRDAELQPIYGRHVNHGPSAQPARADMLNGLTINIRTFGKDKATLLAGVVWAIEQIQRGRITVCYILGWEHCDWPELKDWLTQVLALVQQPSLFPGAVPPVVVPVPPDPPPVTTKPDKDRAQIAGAVAAIAGAFVSLFTWWKKRKKKP